MIRHRTPSAPWCAALAALALVVGCANPTPLSQPAQRFEGVSASAREITTDSPDAQAWFDQGLTLLYGFNHDEATRSFHAATVADPDCTMAWWGLAIASGIDLNDPRMSERDNHRANRAARMAVETSPGKPGVEVLLARAIQDRFEDSVPDDRTELNRDYASSMQAVYNAYPEDDDVAALFAESLMAQNPWSYWTSDGEPKGRTEEALEVLETLLARNPDHAGGNHFLIHLLEAEDPERAEAAADKLAGSVPGSGHLLHMPSHIYVHVGRYDAAADVNEAAIEADHAYFAGRPDAGNYFGYYAHNVHMLAYSAMMEGRQQVAVDAARQLDEDVTDDIIREDPAWLDGLMATTAHVLVRFGRWDDILEAEMPARWRHFSRAQWRYARGVALSALGRTEEARAEQALFEEAAAKVPEDWAAGSSPSSEVLQLARHMLEGEISWREGDAEKAYEELAAGVEIEDGMKYGEPPGWMQPVRHAYGALLMAGGKAEEAEGVYRADLERNPGNGWSLLGLEQALAAQGKADEAAAVGEQLAAVWARADIEPGSSCFCEPGA